MTLIDDYEQQYSALIAEITALIGRLKIFTGAERRELCTKIDSNLSDANELLEQIGLEIRELQQPNRQNWNSKLNCYQSELKRLTAEYHKSKERSLNNYDSTDDFDDIGIQNDQKQRLLDNSEKIERTGKKLTDGYRIVLETEQIGNLVLQDLNHQRETLQSARSKLRETNADIGRSSRILNSMVMRALREKIILYSVGAVFVIIVVLSIYLSVSR